MSVRQLSSGSVGLSVYNTVVLPPGEDASKELAERCAAMNVPLPRIKRTDPYAALKKHKTNYVSLETCSRVRKGKRGFFHFKPIHHPELSEDCHLILRCLFSRMDSKS